MLIHFLHDQLISLYSLERRVPRPVLVQAMRRALFSCAFLSEGPLIMPTTDLVQSPVIDDLMDVLKQLALADALYFVGSTIDIDQLKSLKIAHFDTTGFHNQWATGAARSQLQPFQPNLRSRILNTTAEVRDRWMHDVTRIAAGSTETLTPTQRQLRTVRELIPARPSPSNFEQALIMIPQRLEDHAFLWHVVEKLKLFRYAVPLQARNYLERALAWNWARSYLDEYETTMVSCIPGLGYVDCGISDTHPESTLNLTAFAAAMKCLGLARAFQALSISDVLALRHDPQALLLRDSVVLPLTRYFMTRAPRRPADRELMMTAASIADVARGAFGPSDAIARAALQVARRWISSHSGADIPAGRSSEDSIDEEDSPVRIIVVIALIEELSVVKQSLERVAGQLTLLEDARTGRLSYTLIRRTHRGGRLEFMFSLVGRGNERAATTTAILVSVFEPDVIVNIGIAGAMSGDDVRVGDVVAGNQLVNYLANAKAKSRGQSGYTFTPSGDALRSDEFLIDRFQQLGLVAGREVQAWSSRQHARLAAIPRDPCGEERPPRLSVGPIASGPIVSASAAFKNWLLGMKRDYAAIDMETAGVALAAEIAGMVHRIRFLALRGISDNADENKNAFERDTSGTARRLALEGAIEAMLLLFDTLPPDMLGRARRS